MAITRSQQAKQMLQDGGMLVQPGFGGMRQGYRGDDMGEGIASLDTNRLAVKLLADGGFIDDEERQAYGFGSIVRKITRPIKLS